MMFSCLFDDTRVYGMQVRKMLSQLVITRYSSVRSVSFHEAEEEAAVLQREFPNAPIVGVGAVVVHQGRVLLVQRGHEPSKGKWSLPGGVLELGESLADGVVREVEEETGLKVEVVALIELIDRIQKHQTPEGERVRYHYVIADYLCRVVGGSLLAASDAEAVRWVERAEWNSPSALALDPVTVRVVEAGWQLARSESAGSAHFIELENEKS
jgi:8-oxo-dGTP diphosphatase